METNIFARAKPGRIDERVEKQMIKLVYCLTRKPGLSHEEFSYYWRNIHGPIGAKIPGLRRLVQSHTLAEAQAIRPADYDGMAELWFDDLEALAVARDSAEWRASTEDEKNFVDPNKVAIFITEEHEIV
jgi:uncharacterized protein (TIGR02118 family)